MCILSALFVYYRAKLGYGLLSGDYSKPVPDPGEENGAAEPRVSRRNQSYWIQKTRFKKISVPYAGIIAQKSVRL